ncbi:neuropeptide Y receptor type 2-like [Ylistrum balloti]|uniref:neuropeptide Y receptor type 2-like n=1 Tax=Ylistrum balloti TaxID=509963 RepID=UPI002905CEAC|nr:neuropeptide Y receptor type 2-like [Ylistrum balloti]XP_060076913.1 neuropeptide Y receptor type 2-like [Ylistrum balloti]
MGDSYFNKSWFYGIHEYGFGNSSFFTFMSEFNRPWSGLPYIEALVFIVLFLFSMFGNILIFYQMFQTKSTRTVTNCMIANLAMADILFSFGSPFIAITRLTGDWIFGNAVCKVFVYLLFTCAMVMIWTMTVISIDRHICINKTTSKKMTPQVAVAIIIITWVVCLLCFIPLALYFHTRSFLFGHDYVTICTLSWPKTSGFRASIFFTVLSCLLGFVIPIAVMSMNYFKIIRKFVGSRRAILHNHNRVDVLNSNSLKTRKNRDQRDVKLIKTLLLLVFLFMLMWLPIFVVFVIILIDGMMDNMQVPSIALIITVCIALANACVNPFLYGVINDKIRRAIFKCFACKNAVSTSGTGSSIRQSIRAISYSQNSSNSENMTR